jgi:sporulation protein YlmC with PRC-barrel domain
MYWLSLPVNLKEHECPRAGLARESRPLLERKERLVDRDKRLKELDDKYEDYAVYDNAGEKIGKVDDLFIDETDRQEYIGVEMGLFGLSGKTLIPMEIARVDEQERRIEVAASKDQAKNAPHYHDDDDINHEFEAKIRDHFGLQR